MVGESGGIIAEVTHFQMVADNMPVLAFGACYHHRAMVVPLLRDAVLGAMLAGPTSDSYFVGWDFSFR